MITILVSVVVGITALVGICYVVEVILSKGRRERQRKRYENSVKGL